MSEFDEVMIEANYGATKKSSIIKVIGVGGAGNNAVQHMYNEGIVGVDFLVCNTDRQALESNRVPNKLVLGETGLGAGADPEKAEKLATDCEKSIREFIGEETKMLFITAGMGKGTGTGASPVIARIAQEMGVLTIAVVTYPYQLEGPKSANKADKGIAELKKYVDSFIVIQNQKIMEAYVSETIRTALGRADDVLKNAVQCIAELITVEGYQNVDFNDVLAVMKGSGEAMIGLAEASGENRIQKVVSDAMTCPLINDANINNARKFLFFVRYGEGKELTIGELNALSMEFNSYLGPDTEVIWGHAADKDLDEKIKLSVIITGYSQNEISNTGGSANNNHSQEVIPEIVPSNVAEPVFSAPAVEEPIGRVEDTEAPKIVVDQASAPVSGEGNLFEFSENADIPVAGNVITEVTGSEQKQAPESSQENNDPFDFLAQNAQQANTRPTAVASQPVISQIQVPANSQIHIMDDGNSNIYEDDNAFASHVNTPAYVRMRQAEQAKTAQSLQQSRMTQMVQPAQPMPQASYSQNIFFGVIPAVD